MKFFKKENHREPNNRYDVFQDIANLEKYKNEGGIDIFYFMLATDHNHYYSQETYSEDTKDFDFRNGAIYHAGTMLSYKTDTPYGEPIVLQNDYRFTWAPPIGEKYFLKLAI